MKIPGIVRMIGLILVAVVINSVITIALASVLSPPNRVQELVLQYSKVRNSFPLPGIDTVLALSTIILERSMLEYTSTAAIWWAVAGIVSGAALRNRRAITVGCLISPLVIALVAGYPIMASYNYGSNPLWELASKHAINGLIAGLLGTIVGVEIGNKLTQGRRIAQQRAILQQLYSTNIEPLKSSCPKCGSELNSLATYCGVCGTQIISQITTPQNNNTNNKK